MRLADVRELKARRRLELPGNGNWNTGTALIGINRLYWSPWAPSYVKIAVIEELQLEVEYHGVDLGVGQTLATECRKVQPLDLIAALGLNDGRSVFEQAAINLHLCDTRYLPISSPEPGDDTEAPTVSAASHTEQSDAC